MRQLAQVGASDLVTIDPEIEMNGEKILKQRGVALVVSLVFMLLLTLIGISAMQTTILNGKMAGNARDLNQAFQAAESALRAGETQVESAASLNGFMDIDGVYDLLESEPNYETTTTWEDDAVSIPYGGDLKYVSAAPRYFIKLQAVQDGGSTTSGNIYGYGKGAPGQTGYIFKITAKGTGSTDNSTVYLQSNYGKLY